MEAVRRGYARCSTDGQDLTVQRCALARLGVGPERVYTGHGLSGRTPTSFARANTAVPRGPRMREIACRVPQDRVALPAGLEKGGMQFRDRLQFMDD